MFQRCYLKGHVDCFIAKKIKSKKNKLQLLNFLNRIVFGLLEKLYFGSSESNKAFLMFVTVFLGKSPGAQFYERCDVDAKGTALCDQ